MFLKCLTRSNKFDFFWGGGESVRRPCLKNLNVVHVQIKCMTNQLIKHFPSVIFFCNFPGAFCPTVPCTSLRCTTAGSLARTRGATSAWPPRTGSGPSSPGRPRSGWRVSKENKQTGSSTQTKHPDGTFKLSSVTNIRKKMWHLCGTPMTCSVTCHV